MQPGNSFITGLAYYPGTPVNISASTLDCPPGTLVLDYSTPAAYLKTSALGDNSGYVQFVVATSAGAVTIGSTLTLSGALVASTSTRSGPGVLSVTTVTSKLTTTGVGDAITLANGTDGQIKTVLHDVDGGSAVLTPATKTGFTTITFTAVGETATLQYATTRGWFILALNGAVAA